MTKLVILAPNGTISSIDENAKNIELGMDWAIFDSGEYKGLKGIAITKNDSYSKAVGDSENISNYLDDMRERKKRELSASCQKAIYAGFKSKTTGHQYGYEAKDQRNFTIECFNLINFKPDVSIVDWNTDDAGVIHHSRKEFFAVAQEGLEHKQKHVGKYFQLSDNDLINAETIEKIKNIKF